MNINKVVELSKIHKKPADSKFVYGTAGFRMNASLLDSVMFSVGLLAVLRSKQVKKTIGVMITASHNPAEDNGVKLVEPLGEMLIPSWESHATRLANAESGAALYQELLEIAKEENIDMDAPAKVVVGRDTRPSGDRLLSALRDGVLSLDAEFDDRGLMTTPLLHYLTRCLNTAGTPNSYGDPTPKGYYTKLAKAFENIVSGKPRLSTIYVDCANGIGAEALKEFVTFISADKLAVCALNDDLKSAEKLNFKCGADFVKMNQKGPSGLTMKEDERYASFDGDADRIVYYYLTKEGSFALLDGDKIATLAAGLIQELVATSNLKVKNEKGELEDLHVGLVQTAYANGSSTAFVKEQLKVPVVFTQTGVKHLHHEAEHFDVGVYFEANGHGTVLFSSRAQAAFKDTAGKTNEQASAMKVLENFADLINQTVGDALSDMLMVEAILTLKQMTLAEWDSQYTDLPSRQVKVKVANRHMFVPINADTELKEPAGLQEKINAQVAKFKNGRSFVRPSGTEDVVRVYAEANDRESTELLAGIICGIVFDEYGGVGERPAYFK